LWLSLSVLFGDFVVICSLADAEQDVETSPGS